MPLSCSAVAMARHDRQAARGRGQLAEWTARWWLRLHGWRVLAYNLRTPVGEVDLIIKRGRTLAFVEVKRRATETDAAHAIRPHQQARIQRAASWYLAQQPQFGHCHVRYDAVLVTPGRLPQHVADAWREGG